MSVFTLWKPDPLPEPSVCVSCEADATCVVDHQPICDACLPAPCQKCGRFCLKGMWPSEMCGRQGPSGHGDVYKGYAQGFDPVVVHYNPKTGEYRFPGSGNSRVPKGYQRQELTNMHQVRRFQRDWNQSERRKVDESVVRSQIRMEQIHARHRPELRMAMQSMSEFGRDFARTAMKINDERGTKKAFDPGCHLEVFEYDRSNREPHRDGISFHGRKG